MNCPRCGQKNRDGARFCDACGQPLTGGDPGTSVLTPPELAEKIRRGRPAEGERRTVTVLFVDAVESTPLAEKLGEEAMYGLMRDCLSLMADAVHAYEGHVAAFTGDGLMALFGAPIAHEDAARRAVAAALRLQASLSDYSAGIESRSGVSCRFRVGVNTGPVVVGTVADDLQMDFTAVGDTVNLAARLEQIAPPGAIVVSERTRRAAAAFFDWEPLGELALKGKGSPVVAWRVRAERAWRTRFEAAAERGLTPLVGREAALAKLVAAVERTQHGRGGVLFVCGEPGIGKSRLIRELRRRLPAGTVNWWEGHCVSYGHASPYLPIVGLLKSAFEVAESDDDARVVTRIDGAVASWDQAHRKVAPYLKFVLSVDPGDPAVTGMDPQERRLEVFDALAALLDEATRRKPLVVVVEDLHWADQLSIDALNALLPGVGSLPVLLLVTHRPEDWRPTGGWPSLELGRLDERDSATLTERVFGEATLAPEVRRLVTDRAEGNPFHIEEVARSLIESGVVVPSDGTFRLVRPAEEVELPGTIQEVILSRIDRLDREAREVLQLASVVGREFTARVLDRIAERGTELPGVLGSLTAVELIFEKARFPELTYMFKHALIHDVAYGTLLSERRCHLHRLVGAAIEKVYADRLAEHYETLAHHYAEGRELAKALAYLEKAGDKAAAAYSNEDALAFYARALDVCNRLGDETADVVGAVATKRGLINFGVGDMPAGVDDFDRVVEAGRRVGNRTLEGVGLGYRSLLELYNHDFEQAEASAYAAWSLVGEGCDDVRPVASLALGSLFMMTGRLAELEPLLAWAELVPDMPDAFTAGLWSTGRGLLANWQGDFETAQLALERLPERAARLVTIRLFSSWFRGLALAGAGHYEGALDELHRTLETCERVGDWQVRPRILNTIGWVFAELEDHQRALRWNRAGLDMAGSIPGLPDPEIEMNARLNLADNFAAMRRTGDADEQFRIVEQVVRHPTPPQRNLLWRYSLHFFHSYGALWLSRRDPERALAFADECRTLAESTSSRKYVAAGRRLRGQALAVLGQLDTAEEDLAHALEVAVRVGNPPQLWRTHAAIGDLRRAQGRTDEARADYRRALAVVDTMAAALQNEAHRQTLLNSPAVAAVRGHLTP